MTSSKKWRPRLSDRLVRFLPWPAVALHWRLRNAETWPEDEHVYKYLPHRTAPELKPRQVEGVHPSLPWHWFLPWPSEKERNREDVHGDRRHSDWLLDRGWLPRGWAVGRDRLPAEQPSGA